MRGASSAGNENGGIRRFYPLHRREADADADDAAADGNQNVLGQELPSQTPTAGAERGPHGDLALARDATREREAREVRAADQHDERRGREHDEHGRAQLRPADDVLGAIHADTPALLDRRVLRRDPLADDVHLRARLLERDARLELREDAEPVKIARHVRGLERERLPDLRLVAVEHAGLEHADDLVGLAVQHDAAADGRRIRAEAVLPQRVGQHDDLVVAELVLAGREQPPVRRRVMP